MAKKLSTEALVKLKLRKDIKLILVNEFGLDPVWGIESVRRWMRQNKPNSPLTTKASLRILTKELNMPEGKILIDHENTDKIRERGSDCIMSGLVLQTDCCTQGEKHSHCACGDTKRESETTVLY